MPKRRLTLAILALGILAALIFTFTRTREPSYKGRSLSQWLERYGRYTLTSSEEDSVHNARQEAAKAIQAIGTDAIPYLVRWIPVRKRPGWEGQTAQVIRKAAGETAEGIFIKTVVPDLYRAKMAPRGFCLLGPQAQAAVPELSRLMNDTNILNGEDVTFALACLGEKAISPLTAAMTNPAAPHRVAAISAIHRAGTAANQTVPVLLALLHDRDAEISKAASNALRRIDRHALSNALLNIAPDLLTNAPPP